MYKTAPPPWGVRHISLKGIVPCYKVLMKQLVCSMCSCDKFEFANTHLASSPGHSQFFSWEWPRDEAILHLDQVHYTDPVNFMLHVS